MNFLSRKLSRGIEQLESRDMLTVFTVTQTTDTGDTDTVGSLSWAIEGANIIGTTGDLPEIPKWNSVFEQPGLPSRVRFALPGGANTVSMMSTVPDIVALRFDMLGATGTTIIDASLAPFGVGLRYNGASQGSGSFDISRMQLQGFDTPAITIPSLSSGDDVTIDNVTVVNNIGQGINIADLPTGSGSISITNSGFQNNNGAIAIGDNSPPSSPAAISITNNQVFDEAQFGIAIGANARNVTVSNNTQIQTNGVPGILLEASANDITIRDNDSFVSINAAAIEITDGVSDVEIDDNTLISTNESTITIAANAGNQIRITNNSLRTVPVLVGANIVPPIDLNNDNQIDFADTGDVDSGPNGLLNPPTLLPSEVFTFGSDTVVPFATRFGASGDYRFELFILNASSGAWEPIADQVINNIPAGITRQEISVPTSSLSVGAAIPAISIVAIGNSGSNLNNTSEFYFPSATTGTGVADTAPRIVDVVLGNSSVPGSRYAYSQIVNLSGQNFQTFNVPLTGATSQDGYDRITIAFNQLVNITPGQLRVKTSDTQTPFLNPTSAPLTGVFFNENSNTFSYEYEFAFASALPSDKYLLEVDSSITDLGNQPLDGEWVVDYGLPDNPFDVGVSQNANFLSGNGSQGGDFEFRFAILYGDANGDGFVTALDKQSNLDIDQSGTVDAADEAIIDQIIANGVDALPLLSIDGDYFDDEKVNSPDLDLWKAAYDGGFYDPRVDSDGNGVIDGHDFLFWQRQFGLESAWYVPASAVAAGTAIGALPTVNNIVVSGSQSTHAPFDFSTVDGSGNQLLTVPVGGADTISVTFSEDVDVHSHHLFVVGLTTANIPNLLNFSYDSSTFTATWQLGGWALADQFILSLSDTITDADGNNLDGEWTNPANTTTTNAAISEFPSGDGTMGGRFSFVMALLPGDATLDGVVDINDFVILATNYNQQTGQIFQNGDFNGDGQVNVQDLSLLSTNWQTNLQSVSILADFDGDNDVDSSDLDVIVNNSGMTNADWEDGDLNGDGEVTLEDLDLAYAQYGMDGLGLSLVS